MRAVTADFDGYRERLGEARQCLVRFLPCLARISSGGRGFHVFKICDSELEYSRALRLKEEFDDPVRRSLDKARARHGLTGGLLNNVLSDPWIYTSDVEYPFCFCWDQIPGRDSQKLAGFLQNKFGLAWARTAQIESTDAGTTIKLAGGNNLARLRANHDRSDVTLEINGKVMPEEFVTELQNGELMIYCTWSDIKCVELVEKTAGNWINLEDEEDVRAFLNGHESGVRLGEGATGSGSIEVDDRPGPAPGQQDRIRDRFNGRVWKDVSSVFWHVQFLVGKGEPLYRTSINHKDVLPGLIAYSDYDGAITKVFQAINALLKPCISAHLSTVSGGLSEAISSERPASRRYELEISDNETGACVSALTYCNGEIRTLFGVLPAEEIKAVLKRDGRWERRRRDRGTRPERLQPLGGSKARSLESEVQSRGLATASA